MLVLFLRDLGDHSIRLTRFGTDEPEYRPFLATTWITLKDQGYLDLQFDGFGDHRNYTLTERGWLKALQLSGAIDSPEIHERAIKLVRYFKQCIEGHGEHDGAIVDIGRIAQATGLPEGWVANAVHAGLLQLMFPNDRMGVTVEGNYTVRIPGMFGHSELDI